MKPLGLACDLAFGSFTYRQIFAFQCCAERMERNRQIALCRLYSKRSRDTAFQEAPSSSIDKGPEINLSKKVTVVASHSDSALLDQPATSLPASDLILEDVYSKEVAVGTVMNPPGKIEAFSSPAENDQVPGRCLALPEVSSRHFDYLVVIDFEATCDQFMLLNPQEIIEFPSVLVNAKSLTMVDTFQAYVKPVRHPKLTEFCKYLTGIQQPQVDEGVSLEEALLMHDTWLEWNGIKETRFSIVTWTDWDCKTMLEAECKLKGIQKPTYFNRWINLKVPFQRYYGQRCNLKDAVALAGLKWEGRHHCGLDDAKNTSSIALELLRRGVDLNITCSLEPPTSLPPEPTALCIEGANPSEHLVNGPS